MNVAPPQWRIDWDLLLWMGFRRYKRHWSIPQIQAELQDTYQVTLSVALIADYLRRYQTMVAARHHAMSQLQQVYRDVPDLMLTIDGIQPEKGHETIYVVRELRQQRIWFADSLLSSATEEIQALIRRARLLAERLKRPVCGWMSDKQEAFVTAIAAEFPGTPHRYCANHFLRDLAAPMLAVDSAAKVRMRHKVRGLRALERICLQDPPAFVDTSERLTAAQRQWAAQLVLSYCAAVRGILNDAQGGPLWPPGWNMAYALREVCQSLDRNLACSPTPITRLLKRLRGYIQRGLAEYEKDLGRIGTALGQVLVVWALIHPESGQHHAYHTSFQQLAKQSRQAKDSITQHIGQLMVSFEAGLFCGGEALDLPEDNLELERWIKGPKGHERHITGRQHVGLRMVAEAPTLLPAFDAHLSRRTPFTIDELLPYVNADIPASQQEAMTRHRMMRKARSKKNEASLWSSLKRTIKCLSHGVISNRTSLSSL
ncbi:MAG: transposase [Gammaproteobacteria bacterium]|nr:transposase [Gammaproteobacteria bacterium]